MLGDFLATLGFSATCSARSMLVVRRAAVVFFAVSRAAPAAAEPVCVCSAACAAAAPRAASEKAYVARSAGDLCASWRPAGGLERWLARVFCAAG